MDQNLTRKRGNDYGLPQAYHFVYSWILGMVVPGKSSAMGLYSLVIALGYFGVTYSIFMANVQTENIYKNISMEPCN